MLYQTTHFSFSSHPLSFFLHPPSSSPYFSSSFSTPSPFQVVEKEMDMECIVKGGGFELKQTTQQQQQQVVVFFEHISTNNNVASTTSSATGTSVAGEDLFVDQLLNLNNGEGYEDDNGLQQFDHKNTTTSGSSVVKKEQHSQQQLQLDNQTPTPKKSSPLDSVLSVPAEEADLEWLSQFVEESFSQFSTPYPPGYIKPKPRPRPNPEFLPEGPYFTPLNLSKSRRSKRARTGGRVWSAALTDPSSPSTTSPGSPTTPELGPPKMQRKKDTGPTSGCGGPPRRCSHCGVQKTPQWRAGPMGAKTLCNACGVRFKSGRLLPEYRPACSPTFSSELHSNSHRKVLEMRRKKEMVTGQPEPGGMSHPLSSFG